MYRSQIWTLVAFSVLAIVAGPAADAGEQVPFKGRDAGPVYLDSVDFEMGIAVVFADAYGHSTLLGRHFARTTIIVDLLSGVILSASTTFYAASGDSITEVLEETVATPDPFTVISRSAIVGGTGRFEGAQGHFQTISHYDKVPIPANLPLNAVNVWSGVISSPGANK